jgi:hypothetical protein
MPPAFSASRAGATQEASGHGSSGTFGNQMKPLLAILFACFAAVASSRGEDPEPITVAFTVRAEGWFFTAYPDGSIRGQFGSLPGDAIRLPPGTADFSEIVSFVKASKAPSGKVEVEAAVRHKDEVSVTLKPVEDNGYFRKLFLKHRDGWLDWMKATPNGRLVSLMQRIEYYKQPNKAVDSTR